MGQKAEAARAALMQLEVRDLTVRFGGLVAIDNLSLQVTRGSILGLIGPNGAGKSTLFNCISRTCAAARGSITVDGVNVLALPTHRIARAGVGRTFQHPHFFPEFTVIENVLVGAHSLGRVGAVQEMLRLPSAKRDHARARDAAWNALELVGLAELAHQPITQLPYGTVKRVDLARALACEPKLLLLDEPAGGLSIGELDELGGLLMSLRRTLALTVVLVEHHMNFVCAVSDRLFAMHAGRKITEGPPNTVRDDERVREAYLGRASA